MPNRTQNEQYGQRVKYQQIGQLQIQPYFEKINKLQYSEKSNELIILNDGIKDSINGIKFQK